MQQTMMNEHHIIASNVVRQLIHVCMSGYTTNVMYILTHILGRY